MEGRQLRLIVVGWELRKMAEKVAHMERIPDGSYIMRVGPEGWEYGDPYELFVVVVDLGEGSCEVRGCDKPISPSQLKAMAKCAREHGFTAAVFDRIKNGKKTRKQIVICDQH
jgi:hypothetical protein